MRETHATLQSKGDKPEAGIILLDHQAMKARVLLLRLDDFSGQGKPSLLPDA